MAEQAEAGLLELLELRVQLAEKSLASARQAARMKHSVHTASTRSRPSTQLAVYAEPGPSKSHTFFG